MRRYAAAGTDIFSTPDADETGDHLSIGAIDRRVVNCNGMRLASLGEGRRERERAKKASGLSLNVGCLHNPPRGDHIVGLVSPWSSMAFISCGVPS